MCIRDRFKGLSTFAVEMLELRTILNLSDKNSLILGDELCSGTENDSALSIFVSGLEMLHEKGSTFLFATHFHEIVGYEEIENLDKLKMFHMTVIYDKITDKLCANKSKLFFSYAENNFHRQVKKILKSI